MKSVFSVFAVLALLGSFSYSEETDAVQTIQEQKPMNKPHMRMKKKHAMQARKAHHKMKKTHTN